MMKHNMKKIISLVLVLAMSLAISVPGFAAEKENQNAKTTRIKEISTEVTDISREEFLKSFAKQKGISLAEADKFDKLQTLKDNKDEVAKYNISKQQSNTALATVTPMATVYKQIKQTYNTGSYGSFYSKLIVIIQVKLERYNSSSFGTYQKFAAVTDVGSSALGSGSATWNKIAESADIYGDTGYENKIAFMLSGNLEVAVTQSVQIGYANQVGFSVGTSVGGTYYMRKFVSIDDTFSSNYDLT
ncbi:hypothetical protein [Caproiciproducens sp.]